MRPMMARSVTGRLTGGVVFVCSFMSICSFS